MSTTYPFLQVIHSQILGIYRSSGGTRSPRRQVSSIPGIHNDPHDRPLDKQLGAGNKQEAFSLRISTQSTPSSPRLYTTSACDTVYAETRTQALHDPERTGLHAAP